MDLETFATKVNANIRKLYGDYFNGRVKVSHPSGCYVAYDFPCINRVDMGVPKKVLVYIEKFPCALYDIKVDNDRLELITINAVNKVFGKILSKYATGSMIFELTLVPIVDDVIITGYKVKMYSGGELFKPVSVSDKAVTHIKNYLFTTFVQPILNEAKERVYYNIASIECDFAGAYAVSPYFNITIEGTIGRGDNVKPILTTYYFKSAGKGVVEYVGSRDYKASCTLMFFKLQLPLNSIVSAICDTGLLGLCGFKYSNKGTTEYITDKGTDFVTLDGIEYLSVVTDKGVVRYGLKNVSK